MVKFRRQTSRQNSHYLKTTASNGVRGCSVGVGAQAVPKNRNGQERQNVITIPIGQTPVAKWIR
jgi:hypothetical protein